MRITDQDFFSSSYLYKHLILHASKTRLPLPPFFRGRRFAELEWGTGIRFALLPTIAKIGDVACLLSGSKVPFVIRSLDAKENATETEYIKGQFTTFFNAKERSTTLKMRDHFHFVGESFIDGFMNSDQSLDDLKFRYNPRTGKPERFSSRLLFPDLLILH